MAPRLLGGEMLKMLVGADELHPFCRPSSLLCCSPRRFPHSFISFFQMLTDKNHPRWHPRHEMPLANSSLHNAIRICGCEPPEGRPLSLHPTPLCLGQSLAHSRCS